jgi:hypothetical protein
VISVLRSRGLWETCGKHGGRKRPFKRHKPADIERDRDDSKRTESALGIWRGPLPHMAPWLKPT